MSKIFSNFIVLIVIGLTIANCANRGTPDGGPKDEIPPEIIKMEPENFTTNFKGNLITITFNEFVKLKNIQKQLIISPPMKTQPEITPLSSASKKITIKIFDTLQPNTTYAFNFGNSIVDNNEGNPYPYYRYVFSTGDYIDSLSVTGAIVDALKSEPETFVNVGLYEVDSTFNDSIVYREPPRYITNTLDSLSTFTIENIKAGTYFLVALKDANGDYKFQQKTDKIGFHDRYITIPTDSSYTLKLFSEELNFKASRPFLLAEQKIAFGYEGSHENMKIKITSDVPSEYDYRITKDEKTDTLYYWYKPKIEADSLLFNVSNTDFSKDYTVRLRNKEKDTLILKYNNETAINKPVSVSGSIPFVKFDTTKATIVDKDTLSVDFKTTLDTLSNTYSLSFNKTENNNYSITILPDAFEDFFGNKNKDTLNYKATTKKESDYGYIRFTLNNAQYPLIIQLTNEKGEVKYEQYTTKPGMVDFYNLNSGKYFIRVIYDTNGNGKYDTGNYLKKTQPERVIHFTMDDEEIRPDWGLIQTLNFI